MKSTVRDSFPEIERSDVGSKRELKKLKMNELITKIGKSNYTLYRENLTICKYKPSNGLKRVV